jgi:hypothetical protein
MMDSPSTVSLGTMAESTLQPRAYQYEMFDRSMKRNVIVAVYLTDSFEISMVTTYRWILVAERHTCLSSSNLKNDSGGEDH